MSTLATRFREQVSKLKDYKMKIEAEFGIGYPTGFLNYDFKNGTVIHVNGNGKSMKYYSIGVTDGSMVMIIGRSGSGKTTWATQAAANIIRPFKTSCVFYDSVEGGITENRMELLTGFKGPELKNRFIVRNSSVTAENFYQRVKIIYDLKSDNRSEYEYDTGVYDTSGNRIFKLEPTVYILDSLAMLMPEKFEAEEEISGQMSATAAAKMNSMVFKRIIPMLKTSNIILFIINHINDNVSINPMQHKKSQVSYLKQDEVLPGGRAAIYLSNNIIRFDDHSKLKSAETFGVDGTLVDLGLVKSRTNKAGQAATLVFNQDIGFDATLSLFILLKENNRVKGAGAYLYFGDRDDMKFSQKAFKQKLNDNVELQDVFMKEVIDVLTTQLDNADIDQDSINNIDIISARVLEHLNTLVA